MTWKWTEHYKLQLTERSLSQEKVNEALEFPDSIIDGTEGRKIYQKSIGNKLLRVVTEGDLVITAYVTSKTQKYIKGELQ